MEYLLVLGNLVQSRSGRCSSGLVMALRILKKDLVEINHERFCNPARGDGRYTNSPV